MAIISQEQAGEKIPLALRLSGHLLIGVVRIFSRQVGYLHSDATEAVAKIRKAFKRHAAQADVDLPENQTLAKEAAITLRPPNEDEFSLHDVDVEFGEFLDVEAVLGSQSLNVAEARDITMRSSQGSEAVELALSQQQGAFFDDNLPGAGGDWEVELGRAGELDNQAPALFDDAEVAIGGSEQGNSAPRQLSAAFEQDRDFFEDAPVGGLLDESMAAGRLSVIGGDEADLKLEGSEQVQKKPRRAAPKRRAAPRKRKAGLTDEHTTIPAAEYERRLVGGEQIADTLREVELMDPEAERLEQQQQSRHRRLDLAGDLQELLQAPFEMHDQEDSSRLEEELILPASQPEVDSSNVPLQLGDDHDVNFGASGQSGGNFDDQYQEMNYDVEPMDVDAVQPVGAQNEDNNEEAAPAEDEQQVEGGPLHSKRSQMFRAFLQKKFVEADSISFNAMVEGKSRLTVAGSFYELLLFKTHKIINLKQSEPFGDITIEPVEGK